MIRADYFDAPHALPHALGFVSGFAAPHALDGSDGFAAPHALDGSDGFDAPHALDGSADFPAPQADPQAAAGFSSDFPAPQADPHAADALDSSAIFVHPNKFANIIVFLSAGYIDALISVPPCFVRTLFLFTRA